MDRAPWRIAFAVAGMLVVALSGCSREPSSAHPPPPAADGAAAAPRVVNVYNWADYIAPGVIEEFEAATGIRVNYDTYDSNEMMETKMLAGRSGYDVVVVTAHFLERLIPAGAFRRLDPQLLPSRGNLDADLMAQLALFDPGNAFAVGYHWGTTGIGYDESQLREFAPDAPADSWRLVYDPSVAGKMAGCGLSILDSPTDTIGTALIALGHDPNEPTPEQLAAAERLLLGIRPHVRKIDSGSQINDLSGGTICLLVTWSTNVRLARMRAEEAGTDADFRYVVPREGTIAWFDALAIAADAPHPEAAHAFLEFMLQPGIAARNANFTGTATINAAATPLVDAALRDDPGVYPPAEVRERLQPLRARTHERSRAENRVWSRFQTGR